MLDIISKNCPFEIWFRNEEMIPYYTGVSVFKIKPDFWMWGQCSELGFTNKVHLIQFLIFNLYPKMRHTCMSFDMRFPTMWYVRPTKPLINLPICAV